MHVNEPFGSGSHPQVAAGRFAKSEQGKGIAVADQLQWCKNLRFAQIGDGDREGLSPVSVRQSQAGSQ